MVDDARLAPVRREWRERLGRPLLCTLRPFWRRHPPDSPVSIFELDIRGAFSPVDRFFYNRIPKAANTTLMHFLAERSTYSRPFVRREKDRWLRPSHMTTAQVEDLDAGRVFRFTFVRNPYSRVLSAYRDKIAQGDRLLVRHFGRAAAGDRPDFTAFCRFLDAGGLYLNAHWAPQADLMLLPLDQFDLIGKVETMEADLATLSRNLWGVEPGQVGRVGTVTSATERLASDYTDEARSIVRRLYSRDFEVFDYDPG